jgi:ketopantoate reductase
MIQMSQDELDECIRIARREALEDAAKACDEWAAVLRKCASNENTVYQVEYCAKTIRALVEDRSIPSQ